MSAFRWAAVFRGLGKSVGNHLEIYSLGAMIAGLAAGNVMAAGCLRRLIPFALFMMLYPAFLDADMGAVLRKAIAGRKLLILALLLNFIVSPPLMHGLLKWLSPGLDRHLIMGLLIYSAIPGGGMGPAYTGMIGGNVGLSIAMTTIGLFLSIAFMPLWTMALAGTVVPVPAAIVLGHLFLIVVVPAVLAALSRRWTLRRRGEKAFERFKARCRNMTGIGLVLLVFIIFVVNGKFLMDHGRVIVKIWFPAACFSFILLSGATVLAGACRWGYAHSVAFSIGVGAKNTAVSMALATTVFHDLTALAVAIAGTLVQLPFLLLYVKLRPGPARKRSRPDGGAT
jgi:ACR3 family arsenite efflux pump ArsB